MSPTVSVSERDAIIESLKCGNGVSAYGELLSCYPTSDNWYYVDYIFSEETVDRLNLSDREKKIVKEEEELQELFPTPEEAADFYLKVRGTNEYKAIRQMAINGKLKRTLKDKVAKTAKLVFFE